MGLTVAEKAILHPTGKGDGKVFMEFRIAAGWERGKVYDFLFGFHAVDFVLALLAAAKRM